MPTGILPPALTDACDDANLVECCQGHGAIAARLHPTIVWQRERVNPAALKGSVPSESLLYPTLEHHPQYPWSCSSLKQ